MAHRKRIGPVDFLELVANNVELRGAMRVVGNFGVFDTAPVVQQAALTVQLTTITHTAPGAQDFALQALVNPGFGFATADEGNTTLQVIANLQTRVQQLEDRLQAYGLLA